MGRQSRLYGDTVEDRSHTPHRLQTTLTPAQEAVAAALRKTLPVSLDDLPPVAWSSAPTGGSRTLSKAIASNPAKNRKQRCTAASGSAINNARGPTGAQQFALASDEGLA